MNERKINDGITVAGQPSEDELQQLPEKGFRTVVNLRQPGENGYREDEERLVESHGMNYASIPVTSGRLDDIAVQRFIQAVDSVDSQPALVHCQGGGRAGLMTLLYLAIHNGWSVQQSLEDGGKLGIAPADDSPYRAFFTDYLKRHSAGERVLDEDA